MGCPKHLYHQEQEPTPFIGLWKKEAQEESETQFYEILDEKRGQQKKCVNYYPFGGVFNSWHVSPENNYLFNAGSELNPVTETYETLFRGYDPWLGRFMQIDPLADFLPGINPYQFGFDNPILFNDPHGLAPKWWIRLRAKVDRFKKWLKGSNEAGVAVGKHKGKDFVAQTRGGRRRGSSRSSKPTPHSSGPIVDLAVVPKPQVDPPELPGGLSTLQPPVDRRKRPSPKSTKTTDIEVYTPGQEVLFESNLFRGGTSEFLHEDGVKERLKRTYRSLILAPNMKVIIRATTNLTWASDNGLEVRNSGGKTLEEILGDRASAVRDALLELGVPESQIEFGSRPLYGDLDGMTTSSFHLKFEE